MSKARASSVCLQSRLAAASQFISQVYLALPGFMKLDCACLLAARWPLVCTGSPSQQCSSLFRRVTAPAAQAAGVTKVANTRPSKLAELKQRSAMRRPLRQLSSNDANTKQLPRKKWVLY